MVLLALIFFSNPLFSQEKSETPTACEVEHECAEGVCFDKLYTPLNIDKIEKAMSEKSSEKMVLPKLHPLAVKQAQKCLTYGEKYLSRNKSSREGQKIFIGLIGPFAQNTHKDTGVSVPQMVGSAALETGWGEKPIGEHNYWGIKGEGGIVPTHEEKDGKKELVKDEFRSFSSLEEACNAYGKLVVEGKYFGGGRDDKEKKTAGKFGRFNFPPFYDPIEKKVIRYIDDRDEVEEMLNIIQYVSTYRAPGYKPEKQYASDSNYVPSVMRIIDDYQLMKFNTFEGVPIK